MIGLQFIQFIALLDNLQIQSLQFLRVIQLQLIYHFHTYDVCIIDPEVGIDASKLLVFNGE